MGPNLLIDLLSEFQFTNTFYKNYRDHILHQLKVFLLGLYFFDNLKPLRESIISEITADDFTESTAEKEFIRRWLICAVFHDNGYVLEAYDKHQKNDIWARVRTTLNNTLEAPLGNTFLINKSGFSVDHEQKICFDLGKAYPHIKHQKDIEKFEEKNLFDYLKQYSLDACLGKECNPIQNYYNFASNNPPKSDDRFEFYDHGVASSLFLLNIWFKYKRRLSEILLDPKSFESFPILNSISKKIKNSEKSICAAAGAISLHNITPKIWENSLALRENIDFDSFCICLTNTNGNAKALPLAFLLCLVDILQDWGRVNFRGNDPDAMIDQDLEIQVFGNYIYLQLAKDVADYTDAYNIKTSGFNKAKETLAAILEKQPIDFFLQCGLPKKPKQIKPVRGFKQRVPPLIKTNNQISQKTSTTRPPALLNAFKFVNNVNSFELANMLTTKLMTSNEKLANKYLYLGPHGAEAWMRVEKTYEIKKQSKFVFDLYHKEIFEPILKGLNKSCFDIVSLGTGTGNDDVSLLTLLRRYEKKDDVSLFAIDLSLDLLQVGSNCIAQSIHATGKSRSTQLHAICTDIEKLSEVKEYLHNNASNDVRLFHLLGLTLGNNRELDFLSNISSAMKRSDFLLLGVDFSADNKELLGNTLNNYLDAGNEVANFLCGPLKTAIALDATKHPNTLKINGEWRHYAYYDYLKHPFQLVYKTERKAKVVGLSDIPDTVSLSRYYSPINLKSNGPKPRNKKLCDYSNKYNSTSFLNWLMQHQPKLRLKLVNKSIIQWGYKGQYLVLLERY